MNSNEKVSNMNNFWDSTSYQQTIWLNHSLQIITDKSYVHSLKRGTYIMEIKNIFEMNIIRYSIFLWIILSKESHIIIKQWKFIDLLRISSPVKLSKVNAPNSKYKSQTFANLYPE